MYMCVQMCEGSVLCITGVCGVYVYMCEGRCVLLVCVVCMCMCVRVGAVYCWCVWLVCVCV